MSKKQKILSLLCMIAVMCIFPLQISAEQLAVMDTDLNIELDLQEWKVLTRAVEEDASLEEEYGLNYEAAVQWLDTNYIYLYGVFTQEDVYPHMELLVRKSDAVNVTNLSKYSAKELKSLGKALAENKTNAQYDIFQTDYKYAFLSYDDAGYAVREYYTVVNGESYTFTFQKLGEFTQKEIVQMQNVMQSAAFQVQANVRGEGTHSIYTTLGFLLAIFVLWRFFAKKRHQKREEQFLREIEELERKCLEDRKTQDKFEKR